MATAVLDCRSATRRYGTRTALAEATLTVEPGEIVAVLGPNGAGKSTLVRLCAGLIGLTEGTVTVLGLDVTDDASRVREHVGLVLGDAGFYDAMTLRSYLTFFARSYGMTRTAAAGRVAVLLEELGLSDRAGSRLGSLSQGMRQKVALARALLHEPELLLLDEATNGLDPEAAARFRAEISRLRSDRRGIVLCTHLLHEADELADRVVVLQEGRIIAADTPARLKQASQSGVREVVIEVTGGKRVDPKDLTGFGPKDLVVYGSLLRYRTADPEGVNPQVIAALVGAGHGIVQVTTQTSTLEEAYLSLVRASEADR